MLPSRASPLARARRGAPSPRALLALLAIGAADDTAPIEHRDLSLIDGARIVASRFAIHAGQWQLEGHIVDYDVPALRTDSPLQRSIIAMIRQRLAGGVSVRGASCVAPQDPEHPVLMTMPGIDPEHCHYERLRMVGTDVDSIVQCTPSAQSGGSRMVIRAHYERERFTIESHTSVTFTLPGLTRQAQVHSTYVAQRVGDCPSA